MKAKIIAISVFLVSIVALVVVFGSNKSKAISEKMEAVRAAKAAKKFTNLGENEEAKIDSN